MWHAGGPSLRRNTVSSRLFGITERTCSKTWEQPSVNFKQDLPGVAGGWKGSPDIFGAKSNVREILQDLLTTKQGDYPVRPILFNHVQYSAKKKRDRTNTDLENSS